MTFNPDDPRERWQNSVPALPPPPPLGTSRRHSDTYIEELRRLMNPLGPKGAAYVLEFVESRKVNYPDEIVAELVLKAGQCAQGP
jgi:hypothetical protein